MKNKKKREKATKGGKLLVEKAGLAMKNGFHLEAAWLLSLAMERKLKKLIAWSGDRNPGAGFTLEQSVKRIKRLCLPSAGTELAVHVTVDLIDRIRSWKNQRNDILRDIPNVHVSQARLERLAGEGVKLYRELNQASKSMKVKKPVPGWKSPA